MKNAWLGTLGALALATSAGAAEPKAEMTVTGDREVAVKVAKDDGSETSATFAIAPNVVKTVENERYDRLPAWNPKAQRWTRFAPKQTKSQEVNTPHVLVPDSVKVAGGAEPGATVFVRGKDYEVEALGGFVERLEGGAIGADTPVWLSYAYSPQRYDGVFLADGKLALVPGKPSVATPPPPEAPAGATRVGNVLVRGVKAKIEAGDLYPVTEAAFPGPAFSDAAATLLPKTLAKLRSGEPLTLFAMGDSVTAAGYLGNPPDRWQEQFAAGLRRRFPDAKITVKTLGWGGRSSTNFMEAPADSPFHFDTKVAGSGADLVVIEFVNDRWLSPEKFNANYSRMLAAFKDKGIECILTTPHYVATMSESPNDPSPYVRMVKAFAKDNGIALADVSARYGHLRAEGLAFATLMRNSFNHPDKRGMKLYADALLALFPER